MIHCICHSQGTAFETLSGTELQLIHFNGGVGIYSIEAGEYNVFDSHARDMYHNSHSISNVNSYHVPVNSAAL